MRHWILMVGVFVSSTSWAQHTQHITTDEQNSQHMMSRYQASDWGLSSADWQRYQTLMQSPLTYDMQTASPIEVLAQFARDTNERKKLAQKLVEFDKQRADGLLALDAAYRQAWLDLYPTLNPIRAGMPERVVLFVTQGCTDCIDALKAWRTQGVKVDVYMVDSRGNDTLLRQWAATLSRGGESARCAQQGALLTRLNRKSGQTAKRRGSSLAVDTERERQVVFL